jgi:DNA-binding MarR family transcriptional regulator
MTPSRRSKEPATDLADAIHSAAIHVLRYLRTEDEALGLSAPKLSALSVLVFRGPLTVGELARAEQVTPATISRLVTELEDLGLVVRSADEGDARVRRVTPTAEGVALLRQGRRRRVARLAAALERLPASDQAVLGHAASLLERIVSGGRSEKGGQKEKATPRTGRAGRSASGRTASSRQGWKV